MSCILYEYKYPVPHTQQGKMQLRALFSLLLTLIHQLTEKGPVSFHALDGRFHTCFFAPLWPSLLVPVSILGRLLL